MTKENLETYVDELGMTLGECLLTPTRIYVKMMKAIKNAGITVKGCSHITGGGFYENVPRMLPDGVKAVIKKDSYDMPPIFPLMQKKGGIEEKMMYNTFNMGLGMVLAVAPEDAEQALKAITSSGEKAFIVGSIETGEKGVELV
jgi:phosphoribosylformylglycinamidine cyclo-ligase